MLQQKNTIRKGFLTGMILYLLFTGFGLQAQSFAEVDYVVTNKLYDFLIDYEESISKKGFSINELNRFYYNNKVEVFNDLSPDLPDYIPNSLYLSVLDSIKTKSPNLTFYHYNLELIKQEPGLYFDIVHIQLLKEVVNDTLKERNIALTNIISSNLLDFTLLFNKFDGDGEFKILKIENANESMIPDAWHRGIIPDEVRISLGPSFVGFNTFDNEQITTSKCYGFDGGISAQNRFAGGKNLAVSWFAGVGLSYMKSDWGLKYDSTELINQNDAYGDKYTRRIVSNDIRQDLNILYLKAPLGVAVRLFNPQGFSLTFSGELAPRFLLSSDYKTTNGDITYSGTYDETIGGVNYPFYVSNLGINDNSNYDFYTNTAGKNSDGINLEKFGVTLGFSVQASYKVGAHFDVFIAPTWRWGITNMLSQSGGQNLVSLENWEANPIIEMQNNPKFNVTSIEAGMIFRLNNVVKPFVKKTKFKETERTDQKENFRQYLTEQIPYDPPLYAEKNRKKIIIIPQDNTSNYPSKVKYAYSQKSGVEKNSIKTDKTNKLKTPYKGLFLFKPFAYDIYASTNKQEYNAYHHIFADSLNSNEIKLEMSYLPDLNVSIVMKMNDRDQVGVRDKIIEKYIENISTFGDEKCVLYFHEMHGSSIKQLFDESDDDNFCFSCNDASNSINIIEKKTEDGSAPVVSFINELRILLKDDFTLERRSINLDFYIGNSNEFVTAFNNLQNLDKTNTLGSEVWADDKDSETTKQQLNMLKNLILTHPVEVNQFKNITFYIDYNDDLKIKITDLYYSPREAWQKEPFVRNTHKLLYQYIDSDGFGKKSIRLRNFEFKKM